MDIVANVVIMGLIFPLETAKPLKAPHAIPKANAIKIEKYTERPSLSNIDTTIPVRPSLLQQKYRYILLLKPM